MSSKTPDKQLALNLEAQWRKLDLSQQTRTKIQGG